MAIVVPCRNEAQSISVLLDAIATQETVPAEIIVVDDASIDGTGSAIEAWGRQHPELNLRQVRIDSGAVGAGAAMNVGIRETKADIIVRLDGHSRPAPDYVRRSLEALTRDRAGVVGGTWQVEPGVDTRMARAIAAVVSHYLGSGGAAYRHPSSAEQIERVDTVPFGCFRRSLWDELGGFDERLLANQDYDFNYRARLAGYDVLLDHRITCAYKARPTLRALARQYFRYGFWKLRMLRKFPSALHWRQLPPILLLPTLVVAAAAALAGSLSASLIVGAYLAIIAGSALLIAKDLGDWAAAPHAAAAILTVHITWSAGFWTSIFTPATAAPPRGR